MSEQRTVDGRYRLDKAVGSGGMGVVWRAFDLRLGRVVAVKEVRFPSTMSDDERAALTKRAMIEAQSAGRLDHPNIVPVHDVILDGEQPFIIMRFVEGRSLDQTVSGDGPLPDRVVARIGVQLLDALGAAHAADVIHRDVKPHNVLIQMDGVAQLTDFSIASVFGTETLTKTGALLGSPGYIAPERLMTGATTPGGDLFALGATLFFAAEGIGPFTAKETIVGLFASATRPHPRPKHAGPRLTQVIDGLLEKNPDDRLDSAQARALLSEIVKTPEESETRSGEFMPPPPGRVDTDDNPSFSRPPGAPQGDLPSDNSTAVFAATRKPDRLPASGAPVSGGTVYGRPVSGAPNPGAPNPGAPSPGAPNPGAPSPGEPSPGAPSSSAPSSGAPVSGGVVYGRPVSGAPVSGGVVYGRPISGAPVSGGVVYGRPISDAPVSGGAVSGGAVSGSSVSGGSASGGAVSGGAVSGGAASGGRALAWGPGSGSGGQSNGPPSGGAPTFRPPDASTSPPAGRRWKRVLAVLTIIVLGLGAGIIANLVATQDRKYEATTTGDSVGTDTTVNGNDDDEPTPIQKPGSPSPGTTGAEPTPDATRPDPSPTTSGPSTSKPPLQAPAKVISAVLTVQQPANPVDCTRPVTVMVAIEIATTGTGTVTWSVLRGDYAVGSDIVKVTEKDTGFTASRSDTIAKPLTGKYAYVLETQSPNKVAAGAQSIEITCAPADGPATTNAQKP